MISPLPLAFLFFDIGHLVIWAGVVCTLAIFSLLYKENPVYRFFEHLFVGVTLGYTVVAAWKDVLIPKLWIPLATGQWWMILAVLTGLLYYAIYFRRLAWMSRLLIGVLMGFGAGLAFQKFATQYGPQVAAAFVPLTPQAGLTTYKLINNWVMTLTLIAVMSYFFFAFEQKNRAIQGTARAGRWLLMISFGAIFGQTVMARMALATGRLEFLLVKTGLLEKLYQILGIHLGSG